LINIKHIIYILAYDVDIINKAFDALDIDKKYLDKIIQIKYVITPDELAFNKAKKQCLKNLYKYYDTDISTIFDEKSQFWIVEKFFDLREYKLFLNDLSRTMKMNRLLCLNKGDLAMILLIKSKNEKLFNLIKNNDLYFISEGISENTQLYSRRIVGDYFEKNIKEFFERNSKEGFWINYKEILELLFPYVKNYYSSSTISCQQECVKDDSTITKRIFNAKYFPLYFSNFTNNYIVVDKIVVSLLKNVKSKEFDKEREKSKETILHLNYYNQILFFESLYMYCDKSEEYASIELLNFICGMIEEIADNYFAEFSRFSAKKRATAIVALILLKIDEKQANEKMKTLMVSPKNLFLVKEILYWTEKLNVKSLENKNKWNESMKKEYKNLLKKIVSEEINIYDKENYRRYNGTCIAWDLGNKKKTKKYYYDIIDESNICKFLRDFMMFSESTSGFGYIIDRDSVSQYLSKRNIKTLLGKITENEDDVFIQNVYNKSTADLFKKNEPALSLAQEKNLYSA
jgi:hypothetical protein